MRVVAAKGLGRYSADWAEGGVAMGVGTAEGRTGVASYEIEAQ